MAVLAVIRVTEVAIRYVFVDRYDFLPAFADKVGAAAEGQIASRTAEQENRKINRY